MRFFTDVHRFCLFNTKSQSDYSQMGRLLHFSISLVTREIISSCQDPHGSQDYPPLLLTVRLSHISHFTQYRHLNLEIFPIVFGII